MIAEELDDVIWGAQILSVVEAPTTLFATPNTAPGAPGIGPGGGQAPGGSPDAEAERKTKEFNELMHSEAKTALEAAHHADVQAGWGAWVRRCHAALLGGAPLRAARGVADAVGPVGGGGREDVGGAHGAPVAQRLERRVAERIAAGRVRRRPSRAVGTEQRAERTRAKLGEASLHRSLAVVCAQKQHGRTCEPRPQLLQPACAPI